MARGWESKSVESQIESNEELRRARAAAPDLSVLVKQRELEGLESSRRRILHDLETASHPNHKQSLAAALAHLDNKIASLK